MTTNTTAYTTSIMNENASSARISTIARTTFRTQRARKRKMSVRSARRRGGCERRKAIVGATEAG